MEGFGPPFFCPRLIASFICFSPVICPDLLWRRIELLNFTDKLYYYTKFDQANSVGQVTGQPGMPRAWQLSATRRF